MTRDDEEARDLLDAALRDEIELVSDLVVAASASDRHFTPDEVDALLGVSRREPGRDAASKQGTGEGAATDRPAPGPEEAQDPPQG